MSWRVEWWSTECRRWFPVDGHPTSMNRDEAIYKALLMYRSNDAPRFRIRPRGKTP